MDVFHIQWRNASNLDYLRLLSKYDPILKYPGKAVSLSDPELINFVWTLCRVSQYFYNFSNYPEEMFDQLMVIFQRLSKTHKILQSVMMFNSSIFLITFYGNYDRPEAARVWDRSIRLPTLKRILDGIKEGLVRKCSFSELVTMAFSVTILISVNSCDSNSAWRSNLKNCYRLLVKASELLPSVNAQDESDLAAINLYQVIREWFFNVEFLAMVSSDNGGEITIKTPLDVVFAGSSTNKLISLDNGVNTLRGYSGELNPILHKLYNFLEIQRKKGKNLSGTNLLRLIYRNDDAELSKEAKAFGYELLWDLQRLDNTYRPLKILDLRMDITLKNIDRAFRMGVEFYLAFFFVGKRDPQVVSLRLRAILEMIYAIPYYYTCGIALHWIIYICALGSFIIGDDSLYEGFVDILTKISTKGMFVPQKSIERLNYIKNMVHANDYDNLTDPHQDFIVY
ncbi:DEKNAAC103244 [Brettanomyces naardenensis]|uniref:DEKNAAC103244 n=1 Tax=Brettanomyces naardenensis TaxID=13370 RepID=A0A448YMW1_BRENA|nr:DEKNAAC103244 [Brettanomyces naardenensis]